MKTYSANFAAGGSDRVSTMHFPSTIYCQVVSIMAWRRSLRAAWQKCAIDTYSVTICWPAKANSVAPFWRERLT